MSFLELKGLSKRYDGVLAVAVTVAPRLDLTLSADYSAAVRESAIVCRASSSWPS